MARKTDFEREMQREIEHDSFENGTKRPKRKRGGRAMGGTTAFRMDRRPRRQLGGMTPQQAVGAVPGAAGVPITPRVMPGAVGGPMAPTSAQPTAAQLPMGRAGLPAQGPAGPVAGTSRPGLAGPGMRTARPLADQQPPLARGGRAFQVGGRNRGYPERVMRPHGVEDTSDLNRSRGRYVGESRVPRDDYQLGGGLSGDVGAAPPLGGAGGPTAPTPAAPRPRHAGPSRGRGGGRRGASRGAPHRAPRRPPPPTDDTAGGLADGAVSGPGAGPSPDDAGLLGGPPGGGGGLPPGLGMANGGTLSAKERQAMPKSSFALPGRGEGPKGAGSGSYPIDTEGRARSALSRGAQHASSGELATIKRRVREKYPEIDVN